MDNWAKILVLDGKQILSTKGGVAGLTEIVMTVLHSDGSKDEVCSRHSDVRLRKAIFGHLTQEYPDARHAEFFNENKVNNHDKSLFLP